SSRPVVHCYLHYFPTRRSSDLVYWDKVSGTVPFEDREDASKLLADAEAGRIEEVEVHSIDRLGRDAINVLRTIKRFTEWGVNIRDRKSTRLNSSHVSTSYAVFC